MPKFPKNKKDQILSIVEKWVYFFKYADEINEKELDKIIEGFQKSISNLKIYKNFPNYRIEI